MSNLLPEESRISLADITYDEENPIGKGGFGYVYKGKLDGKWQCDPVAIKVLNPGSRQGIYEFETEISILTKYRHPNLVSLIGFCDENDQMILVYEYLPNGSLDNHLLSTASKMIYLSWVRRLKICIGVARALDYLHTGIKPDHKVIHRDVKSANILLDDNWEAKLADVGLSKEAIMPPNQTSTRFLSYPAGTDGYCDPKTKENHILSKESDVYSFVVVLLEMLCGRLTLMEGYNPDEQKLPEWVERMSQRDDFKLDMITDPTIKESIHPQSLLIFYHIAYQCLDKEYEDNRPTMTWVVAELEKALSYQQSVKEPILKSLNFCSVAASDSESDAFWEKMLPENYEEIIERAYYDETYQTKKELYFLLLDGILIDDTKRFFCLSKENGKKSVMISAAEFIEAANSDFCEWLFLNESRQHSQDLHRCIFPSVAWFKDASKLKFNAKISTQLLSFDTTYGAYLVYRNRLPQTELPILTWRIAPQDKTFYVQGNRFGEVELFHFAKTEETTLEFEFVCFGTYDVTSIYVEAIWLRPLGYQYFVNAQGSQFWPTQRNNYDAVLSLSLSEDAKADWDHILPSDYQEIINSADSRIVYTTTKGLYDILLQGVLVDNGRKLFSLSKLNGKNCYLLSAGILSISTDKGKECHFTSEHGSRFTEIAYIESKGPIKIQARVDYQMLSPRTTYSAFFVYKGLGDMFELILGHQMYDRPMHASFQLDGQQKDSRTFFLKFQSPPFSPKNDQQNGNQTFRPKAVGYPVERDDGWTEVELWQFFNNLTDQSSEHGPPLYADLEIEIPLTLKYFVPWQLKVEGIELRPK